jgi:hypothetical protein
VPEVVRLRILNNRGIDAFRAFLEDSGPQGEPVPAHLLYDDSYSSAYKYPIFLDEDLVFETKQDLGRYLCEELEEGGASRQLVSKDRNFWASIVLLWFDQFCPVDADGTRDVKMERRDISEKYPKYIPRFTRSRSGGELSLRGRRHYALGPYLIFDYNKDTGHQADALLSSALNVWGDDLEQTAGRIEVISNTSLVELIRMLYWDDGRGRWKRGYSTKTRPGNINRLLADLRNQMKLTQDWYSMIPQEIYDSLPSEYDEWK